MRDLPIIYSAPMVLALLEGRKTMTRRLAWRFAGRRKKDLEAATRDGFDGRVYREIQTNWCTVEPGDRLWVKENFWRYGRWVGTKKSGKVSYSFEALPWRGHDGKTGQDLPNLEYAAGQSSHHFMRGKFGSTEPGWHLRPNIFLERQHTRLTLSVVSNKIERLQDISDEDCIREGLREIESHVFGVGSVHYGATPRLAFAELWRSLHGRDAWDANPEVVAISFVVHHCNIDALPRAA